jgi:hypothetical protein
MNHDGVPINLWELAFPAKVDSCTEERTANEQDPIRFK